MTPRELPILAALDQWQDRARTEFPGVIPCRAGCASCCHGPFDIAIADVAVLLDGVRSLPADRRRAVLHRARADVAAMQALEPAWEAPFDIAAIGDDAFDRLSDSLADRPCPLLDDDRSCLVYAHRPTVCRIIGLGMVTEFGDVLENACPIQDQFPAYAAMAPQPFALESFDARLELINRAAATTLLGDPERHAYETTIAGALVNWADG